MRRWTWIVPAVAVAAVALPSRGAQVLASLYKGQTAAEANLVLGGWGSGSARESKDEVLNGTRSILVTTEGYYSGGRINFTQPVDMSRYASMPGVALRFEVRFPGAGSSTGEGGLTPGGGFFQAMPGPPMPGGPRMPGMPGGPPRTYQPGTEEAAPTILTHTVRVVLFSGNVRLAAADQAVDPESNTNGWVHVQVPLAAFRGNGGTPASWSTFKLSRMLVFGDASDQFYIGDISLLQTDLSISDVSAGEEQEIAAGDVAEFAGSANGGAGLKYSWDFDAADGITEDAIGRTATFRYRKAGTYTVTLTVSDPAGVMKPVTKTTTVKVNG